MYLTVIFFAFCFSQNIKDFVFGTSLRSIELILNSYNMKKTFKSFRIKWKKSCIYFNCIKEKKKPQKNQSTYCTIVFVWFIIIYLNDEWVCTPHIYTEQLFDDGILQGLGFINDIHYWFTMMSSALASLWGKHLHSMWITMKIGLCKAFVLLLTI